MTTIEYTINNAKGKIAWNASKVFDELRNIIFDLGKMEAVEIDEYSEL